MNINSYTKAYLETLKHGYPFKIDLMSRLLGIEICDLSINFESLNTLFVLEGSIIFVNTTFSGKRVRFGIACGLCQTLQKYPTQKLTGTSYNKLLVRASNLLIPDDGLQEFWGDLSIKSISEFFGVTESLVLSKARYLKLIKDPETFLY